MKAIIWGAEGQDGFYLSSYLKELDIEVIPLGKGGNVHSADITSYGDVENVIKRHKPDYLFNFAANSTTRHDAWAENHEVISTGGLNILEAIRLHSIHTKVFFSGSGLQFHNTGSAINENTAFEASSMYAVSRIHVTYATRYYRKLGVRAYTGFFFNHDSPRRSSRHINKRIVEVASKTAAGSTEKLEIGDVHVKKEFGFAGDIVKAVWTLVNQDTVMEAVIGTGKAYSIEKWLEICFSHYGLDWRDHVTMIPGFNAEYRTLVSNPSLIQSLGWRHETTIDELADMMRL